MKNTIYIIAILLLVGCRAKKETLKTEIKQSDTLIVKSEVIKAPVLNQSLLIEQICDTITGEVVRFKKVFVVNGDSIQILTNEKNELSIKISQRERELEKKDSIVQKLKEQLSQVSEKVIIKKHWPSIFWSFGIGVALGIMLMIFKPWKPIFSSFIK
jgi:uncharacterized protein YcfL